jgi:F-type H+-transporting ATPase subunit beta
VSLKDALDGCERILRDELEDFPESALYMIGKVDEAKQARTPGATPTGATAAANDGAKSAPSPGAKRRPETAPP